MIDPDILNINIIPDCKIQMLEIESITAIKQENKVIKLVFIVTISVTVIIVMRNYFVMLKLSEDKNDL